MLTTVLIIAIAVLGAIAFFLAGYALSERHELDMAKDHVADLLFENAELKHKVKAHETSLSMILTEMAS